MSSYLTVPIKRPFPSRESNISREGVKTELSLEKKLAYYSDFDINIKDWKFEYEVIELFEKHLLKELPCEWMKGLNEVAIVIGGPKNQLKSPWAVALEYILLTCTLEKGLDTRVRELGAYFEFYNIQIKDLIFFQTLVSRFIEAAKLANEKVQKMREAEENLKRLQSEKSFENIKTNPKELKTCINWRSYRSSRPKYYFLNRVLSPLIIVNERIVNNLEESDISPDAKALTLSSQEEYEKLKQSMDNYL